MIVWALINSTGCIEQAGISRHPPAGYRVMPEGLTPEYAEYLMWVDGAWQERPLFPDPVVTPGRVQLQADATMFVFDAETGAYFGTTADREIELPDPGSYRIEIHAPEPYQKPADLLIEVPA